VPVEPKYHTAEHVLTAVIKELFKGIVTDCRQKGKKVRCDYQLDTDIPLEEAIRGAEKRANEIISSNMDILIETVPREEAVKVAKLKKVPKDKDSIRLVRIGNYDVTPCSGQHVSNTDEIGKIEIRTFHQISPDTIRLTFVLN
jgi:Ser-tRNA(Ala) deacylase AlaX